MAIQDEWRGVLADPAAQATFQAVIAAPDGIACTPERATAFQAFISDPARTPQPPLNLADFVALLDTIDEPDYHRAATFVVTARQFAVLERVVRPLGFSIRSATKQPPNGQRVRVELRQYGRDDDERAEGA